MKNLYLYFSGTGNTRYAVKEFAEKFEESQYNIHSIEEDIDFHKAIIESDVILIGYPIYGSDLPQIMKDFLNDYIESFRNKKIRTLVTQMEFSGDGGFLAYYILKKVNVELLSSIHIKMPYNAVDFKLTTIRTKEEAKPIIDKAKDQIEEYANEIKTGKKVLMGKGILSRSLGFLSQRLWFKMIHKKMQKMVKINYDTCIKCSMCVKECPTDNLTLADDKVLTHNVCTLCYRCVNICPTQSIKLFGRKYPTKQYYIK